MRGDKERGEGGRKGEGRKGGINRRQVTRMTVHHQALIKLPSCGSYQLAIHPLLLITEETREGRREGRTKE